MATKTNGESKVSIPRLLLGKPLATHDLPHQTVSKPIGLAIFASDALSSTAYATEEILLILALAGSGVAVLGLSIPIAIAIAVLLVIVTISYRQTIYAYPNGGGAYIVARDNLGEVAAQIAGAALLTDYILTVAVSVSSGIAQITSAFSWLLPFKVEIALAVIFIVTIINLRGVRESGSIFSIPTYFFLMMMFVTLGLGVYRYLTGTLPTVTEVEALQQETMTSLSLFLILRAFSSGCAALTGIEAISNGITAFKEPRSRNAATTLTWMSGLLVFLFLGITLLANRIHVIPSETETVISQIARTVYGNGTIPYLLTQIGTALILLMAANTSYAGFPRLAALAAGDGFLPRQLTYRGSRLVFSWGIVFLAIAASILVVVADARVTSLIPLYAVGVFLSFTISQIGMVIHSLKIGKLKPGEEHKGLETTIRYDPHWRIKMAVSAFGALCTGIVMIVFAVTKFTTGAWFVVVLIPALVLIFFRIHRHYKSVAQSLTLRGQPVKVAPRPVQTLILVDDVHRETIQMVNFAKSLGHPWRAIHVGVNPEKAQVLPEKWKEYIGEGEIEIIPSPYRALAGPLRDYLEDILEEHPDIFIHVIIGHLAMDSFWQQALHQNTAFVFNLALADLDHVMMTIVSYRIYDATAEARDEVSHAAEPGARTHRHQRILEKKKQQQSQSGETSKETENTSS
ncbi:MAG: APC family permease [Anaerolineae bacterium]|nr:APC family permease [Anaerolineae bacterium]